MAMLDVPEGSLSSNTLIASLEVQEKIHCKNKNKTTHKAEEQSLNSHQIDKLHARL